MILRLLSSALLLVLASCSLFAPRAPQVPGVPPLSQTPAAPPSLNLRPTRTHIPTPDATQFLARLLTLDPALDITPAPSFVPTLDPLACLPLRSLADSQAEYGIVQWVTDGDTVVVDIRGRLHSVRYLGIDAPAAAYNDEYLGQEAKRRNEALVLRRLVQLVRDGPEADSLGQLLRYVLVDGLFVNYALVDEGLAEADLSATDLACYQTFRQAQQSARQAGRGLWASLALSLASPTFTPVLPLVTPTLPVTTPTPTVVTPISQTSTATPSLTATFSPTSPVGATRTPTTTLSPTLSPTLAPTTPVATSQAGVQIVSIQYVGNAANDESDEYVVIQNRDSAPINLHLWVLGAEDAARDFIFPTFQISPGQSCRVYTNEFHPESCGFNFESPQPIWNNTSDCAYLFNTQSELISEYCYPP